MRNYYKFQNVFCEYIFPQYLLITYRSKFFFFIHWSPLRLPISHTVFFFLIIVTIIGKRDDIPLNKERLFVYNKEQTFFVEELFQWIMGSYQTESLFA